MKKLLATLTAGIAALSLAITASAYDINKDLGTGWSTSATILGEEFADVTVDTVVNISITVNEDLVDMPGNDYWSFKPMINDSGWPFIADMTGLTLAGGGDSYVVESGTEVLSFSFSEESLEKVKVAGMAILGHGITLNEMTFSEKEEAPAEEVVEEIAAETTDEVADTTAAAPADDKGSPDTGVEDVAVVAGLGLIAVAGIVASRKRRA